MTIQIVITTQYDKIITVDDLKQVQILPPLLEIHGLQGIHEDRR